MFPGVYVSYYVSFFQSELYGFAWGTLALLVALQHEGLRFTLSTIGTVCTELSSTY